MDYLHNSESQGEACYLYVLRTSVTFNLVFLNVVNLFDLKEFFIYFQVHVF
jgi:hypothetical protein